MPDPSGDFNSSPYVCTSFSVATAPPKTAVPPAPAAAPNTHPIYSRLAGSAPTTPNSPIVLDGPLPPNFIPRTLTNSCGVSTPISRSAGLLCMGTHSGMSIPLSRLLCSLAAARPPRRCTATRWRRLGIGRNSLNNSHHRRRLCGAINCSCRVELSLHGRINSLELLVGGCASFRLHGVHPRPLVGVTTTRSELQASAPAPVVAVVAVAYPRLADGRCESAIRTAQLQQQCGGMTPPRRLVTSLGSQEAAQDPSPVDLGCRSTARLSVVMVGPLFLFLCFYPSAASVRPRAR